MKRAKFDLFRIGDDPMLVPDQDVEISREDMESEDSARDESGFLHRMVTRERVRSWSFHYDHLTKDDYEYLMGLFEGKASFEFFFEGGSCRAYCSSDSITWRNASTGEYRNLTLTIQEC